MEIYFNESARPTEVSGKLNTHAANHFTLRRVSARRVFIHFYAATQYTLERDDGARNIYYIFSRIIHCATAKKLNANRERTRSIQSAYFFVLQKCPNGATDEPRLLSGRYAKARMTRVDAVSARAMCTKHKYIYVYSI